MKNYIGFLIIFFVSFVSAETTNDSVNFDFVKQDIRDIVYAVSIAQGIPIVCDDTVEGQASFRFSGSNFEEATESFLLSNRLYAQRKDTVIVLSKVHIEYVSNESELFAINAYDILPSVLFNKISEVAHIPIVYELLPTTLISLHVEGVKVEEAVSIVMQAFPDYSVGRDGKSIRVAKNILSVHERASFTTSSGGDVKIEKNDNAYSLNIKKGSFFESLETLFTLSENQFCNLLENDTLVTRLYFESSSFNNVLEKLCAQARADYTFYDGMYIVYGVENVSSRLTRPNEFWKTITLKYISSHVFAALFSERFSDLQMLILSDSMVQVKLLPEDVSRIDVFLNLCDIPVKTHLVQLEYITTEKLLKHLPPGIRIDQFTDSGNGYSLFFTGSDESYALLNKALKILDKPAIIIEYDLLVLQVQESESFNWKPSASAEHVSIGDITSLSGYLGSVFSLNLDVVTAFGYTFAAELQSALGENKAEVYVDTTLQGISGSPIHFQNTNTFRYQDTAVDPDTGNPVYSGVTREITAGLVLHIEGWVSGDGMVTTKVTASLSRRGADVSDNGNPPPTSEKIVTTEVRGKSGEPIVLSGLVQNDSSFVEESTPVLSKIPLLGWLFKSRQKNEENTEMIIYLVPHVTPFLSEVDYD